MALPPFHRGLQSTRVVLSVHKWHPDARREVLVNLTRIREIRPYFKSGFLLIMPDPAATEIIVSERQARSLRQRIPGL